MPDQAYAKACTKCGETKPLSEYYVKREHGRERWYSHCKQCHGKVCRSWEAGNREHVRDRAREYDAGPTGARRRERIKKWAAAHPEIPAAHAAVSNALKRGELVRPSYCDACGCDPGKAHDGRALVEAHHSDYSRPLEVRWLCSSCHKAEHEEG